MPINSEQITIGPAIVKWRSIYFNFVNGLTLTKTRSVATVEADRYQVQRLEDFTVSITGTPVGGGQLVNSGAPAAWAAALYYPLSKVLGDRLFLAGADDPLEIIELQANGAGTWNRWTFHRAAVTQVPNLDIQVNKFILGPVTWMALLKRSTLRSAANSTFTQDTTTPLPASWCLDDGEAPIGSPLLYWYGDVGGNEDDPLWHEFDTIGGVKVDFTTATAPITSDATGIIDYRVTNVAAQAEFQPIQPAALVAARHIQQGDASVLRGSLLSTRALNLSIKAPAICCKLIGATLTGVRVGYGRNATTNPICTATAAKTYSSCVDQPPFALVAANDAAFAALP